VGLITCCARRVSGVGFRTVWKWRCTVFAICISSTTIHAHTLAVRIQNSDGISGRVQVGVFKKGPQFLKVPVYGAVVTPNAKEVLVSIEGVATDDYCLSAFHDKNNNGKLDFVFFFPSERTAFSKNYRPMGPPDFEGCAVRIDRDETYTLRLE
jgi:uncharacterized protein (DUF2141 family)